MSRICLDHKVLSSADPISIAKFVHEWTLKGYEPMPLQCVRQWGNVVITMGLFDKGETNEPTKESTGSEPSAETTDTNNSESGDGETEQPKAEEKPKTRTRAKSTGTGNKAKQPTSSDAESGSSTD